MACSFTGRLAVALAATALLTACASHGHAVHTAGAKVQMCKSCYEEVSKVRRTHPRIGTTTTVLRKHMCPDCKTELSIYSENGVLKAKCSHCAPEGVDCDACVPSDSH